MTTYTNAETEAEILAAARAQAVDVLAFSGPFQAMTQKDQEEVYLALVKEEALREKVRRGLVPESELTRMMATDSGEEMGFDGYKPGFEGSTQAFNELVDSVDFPQFVADLLKAVFDANLSGHEDPDRLLHQADARGHQVDRGLHHEDQG